MFEKVSNNKMYIFLTSVLIAFLSMFPSTINSIFVDSDLTFHIYRIQEITSNIINDGIWLPALQGNNLLGYGYLVDIFYPSTFLYPAVLINLFIKNPLISFKILIFIYTIFTFYIAYICSKITTKHNLFSLYFAIFYSLYSYRILGLYENGFLGEFLAYAFLPLIIFGVHRLFKEKKWIMLAIGMIGVLYSHLITLLLASIYIAIYFIINIKKVIKEKSILINLIKTTIITIIIGSGFLLPFIDYMLSDNFKFSLNANLGGILSYGLFELPLLIEIFIQIVIICLCFYLYKKINKKHNNEIIKCYIICAYSFLAITKIFPWEIFEYIPFLKNIQFSIRILNFISPIIVLLFAELALAMKEMDTVFTVSFIAIIITYSTIMLNPSNNSITNYNEIYTEYENYQENTFIDIIAGEYIPSSFSVNNKEIMAINDEDLLINNTILNKNVINFEYINDNSLTTYLNIETSEKTNINLPLTFYKNYKVYLNNKEIPTYEENGRILLKDIQTGNYIIRYEISYIQIISAIISFSSAIIFLIYIIKTLQNYKSMIK